MQRFVLTSFSLALPWLLLYTLYAQWSFPYHDCLRIGHFPNTHGMKSNYDDRWDEWVPFHHLPASDAPSVRLVGLGDSFSEDIIKQAQKHLPTEAVPWRIDSRFEWGISSTARASLCMIAEVDSGAYTDFLLVNVERGFAQIGEKHRPDCEPELPLRPSVASRIQVASDDRPASPAMAPSKPPTSGRSMSSALTLASDHSMRDVWDYFYVNLRRALAPSTPENLPAGKLRTREDLPMSCPHNLGEGNSDHIFFVRSELTNVGTDTSGTAETMAALRKVKAACAAKGMRFHMMLVPDKTTTYADWVLPNKAILGGLALDHVYYRTIIEHLASSDLFDGDDAGSVVNVLDLFESAHRDGARDLFSHGDTHWSATGAGIAFRWFLRNGLGVMPGEWTDPVSVDGAGGAGRYQAPGNFRGDEQVGWSESTTERVVWPEAGCFPSRKLPGRW